MAGKKIAGNLRKKHPFLEKETGGNIGFPCLLQREHGREGGRTGSFAGEKESKKAVRTQIEENLRNA